MREPYSTTVKLSEETLNLDVIYGCEEVLDATRVRDLKGASDTGEIFPGLWMKKEETKNEGGGERAFWLEGLLAF